jgi:transposase InsO family protein
MTKRQVAEVIGTTVESIRQWSMRSEAENVDPKRSERKTRNGTTGKVSEKKARGTDEIVRSPYAPRDPANGLSAPEVAEILRLKKKHPSMGPAQIRAQLKRFKGWRVSVKAIARALKRSGFELVHRGSRPKGPEPTRFEAPRPNALWQADFAEVRVHSERFFLLVFLDDFSRFVVGHRLCRKPSSEEAVAALTKAIARHGKPEAVRTDRGGAFIAFKKRTDFGRYLEAELIDHVVGKSYNPKGGGKVEAMIGTVRRELWDVESFEDREEAELKLEQFIERYNHRRAHMGIDGLTPADRYFGRGERVLETINAISRKRQGMGLPGAPIEEADGAVEVLRLMIVDGVMELRFCGVRVPLGRMA